MTGLPRACTVCGRPSTGSRCPRHADQHYATPVACRVCGKPGPKAWCPDHDPIHAPKTEAERRAQQPWREAYSYSEYHRERQAVLRRAAGRCEKCGRTDRPLEVDHRVPLSTGTSREQWLALSRRDNLWALCSGPGSCHRAKTLRRPR
jgi:5-methylcytosine-specific restriction endonuclease McrA